MHKVLDLGLAPWLIFAVVAAVGSLSIVGRASNAFAHRRARRALERAARAALPEG
jgi:hypothetical protein